MENKRVEQVEQETIKMEEMRKQLSKSEVIGSFIGIGIVGFCFGIGLMLAVKTVNNLECCINLGETHDIFGWGCATIKSLYRPFLEFLTKKLDPFQNFCA